MDTRYTFFWDKMERANYFIETMSELADEPLDGRLIQHLLTAPLEDGGQWDMFANLVEKYSTALPFSHPLPQFGGDTVSLFSSN